MSATDWLYILIAGVLILITLVDWAERRRTRFTIAFLEQRLTSLEEDVWRHTEGDDPDLRAATGDGWHDKDEPCRTNPHCLDTWCSCPQPTTKEKT